ncbi:Undecaprenyl diphosphate synthase [Rhizodiscina lignyota]|uniref:Alkyl transferase n=1 Tax=Rhizodiscina lignyota TaxID=1504668 RepID=A0A9P4IND0_9PEZI|nr:Undecaprenyl diphosphate synthase [Rhizodiscina lignyota]
MSSSLHLSAIRKWFLQSPPVEWCLQHSRELLLGALRQGPVPEHIAFVMDGNRRFARQHQIETIEGHNLGFEALARVLEVCYKSGVKVVTVYAFSIENFKRSKYEVEALMDMAKVKLAEMAVHGALLDRYGAKIQFLGQKDMVRPDVLEAIDTAIEMTKGNSRAILNICAPYTSRDEMTAAIRETVIDYSKPATPLKRPFSATHIARNILSDTNPTSDPSSRNPSPNPSATTSGLSLDASPETSPTTAPSNSRSTSSLTQNFPDPENINAETITSHTFTAGMPPLDLLIRTSGVERLSDFMLWQCHQNTEIVFLDCLWPEFDLWKFMPVLVEWQWRKRQGEDPDFNRGRRRKRAADMAKGNHMSEGAFLPGKLKVAS